MHLLLFGIPYLLDVVQMQENKGGRIKVEQQC